MRKKTGSYLIASALGMMMLASLPSESFAQYHGGGGYGYGPRPAGPRFGFRHRFHGYVGGQLGGLAILSQSTDDAAGGPLSQGGGGGLFGGLRFGPYFSLELNWTITYHNVAEDYDTYYGDYFSAFHLQTFTVDGKLHIPTRGMVEPFFQAGIGATWMGVTWDDAYSEGDYIFASGPTFSLGGGIDVWVSPFFTIGGRALYRGMRFGEPTYDSQGESKYATFVNGVSVDIFGTLHF